MPTTESTNLTSNLTISVEEAAPILGVGRDAAYAAARAREIPVIQCGKHLRIPLGALLKHISGDRGEINAVEIVDLVEARMLINELEELNARREVLTRRLLELKQQIENHKRAA